MGTPQTMSRETLTPLLEAGEEAGCLNLSEFSAVIQDLELDDDELEVGKGLPKNGTYSLGQIPSRIVGRCHYSDDRRPASRRLRGVLHVT